MFDGELLIALHAMHGNRASFPREGDVSYDFLSCGRNLGYIRELQQECPFETPLCSAMSGLLSSYEGHLRNLHEAWQGNKDISRGEARDVVSLSSFHRDIGIPVNFQQVSSLAAFEALNSMNLSRCQGM